MKFVRVISIFIFAAALLFAGCSFIKHSSATKVLTSNTKATSMVEKVSSDEGSQQPVPAKNSLLTPQENNKTLQAINLPSMLVSTQNEGGAKIYDGFGDKNHWRIEFYFSKITSDSSNPTLMYVEGKTRFKKKITSFAGTFKVDSTLKVQEGEYMGEYNIKGTFQLNENKGIGNGSYSGAINIGISVSENNGKTMYYLDEGESDGGGFMMDGNWKSYTSSASRKIVAASYFLGLADNIVKDFTYGERERSISEKYRKYGWDNYWENDEWWSDGSATTTSL